MTQVRVINDYLIIATNNPGQLRAVFPSLKEAVVNGVTICAVPFTLEAARILNNLGFDAHGPIRTRYDWPGWFTPLPHQIHTADFMTLNPRAFVLNGMGSMKTISALWAADYLQKLGVIKRALVVAPLSTLEPTWGQEIFKNFPMKTYTILHGSRTKRRELLAMPHDLYVINHDGVKILHDDLQAREDIDLVIVDECFPKGTKVLTPSGERCIDTLQLNDVVCSSWGPMPITHVFKKETTHLIKLYFEDGTYVKCTREHPFATEEGWVQAKDIKGRLCLRGDDLPYLQGRSRVATPSPKRIQAQCGNKSWEENTWISYLLQSGFWARTEKDRYRGGWAEPRHTRKTSTGQEERSEAYGVRVVRVEDFQLSSPEPVWNIEVAGPHDYIVEGKVVHNCAVYRNARTGRWKVMNSLINKCGFSRMAWGLTGAPTPNAPTDAFGQTKLITPENYRGHFTSFKHETMHQINQFRWIPRKGAEEIVNKVLKPSVRYALEDCVDLPETIYSEREAQLTKEQEKHYGEIKRLAVTEIRGQVITAVNAAVQINKLLQASLGVLYSPSGEIVKIDFGPRIGLLKELIEGCERKVIVFVPLTGALQAVKKELEKHWTVETIDGSISMGKRNQIFSSFRTTKDPHVLVANAAAMSHGLTLTEASTIIWYAPTNSNDVYTQANARIVRPGQKHVTHIIHMYATTEERRTYKVLKEKGRMQDVLLDLVQKGG